MTVPPLSADYCLGAGSGGDVGVLVDGAGVFVEGAGVLVDGADVVGGAEAVGVGALLLDR